MAWAFAHDLSGPNALTVDVRRDIAGRIGSSSLTFATQSGSVPSWRGYVYDAMGRLSVVRESDSLPASLPGNHLAPTAMASAVEAAGNAVTAARWAYAREEAVGSVLSVTRTDTPSAPRFETPGNYQTPFGQTTARLEGHQLAEYEVGNSGTRTVTHDDVGRLASDGTQDFGFDDFGALSWVKEPGGGSVKELYLYDATGRLAATLSEGDSGEVLTYDGAQAVQARGWDGQVVWTATWGPGVDRLVSVEKDGREYFALDDGKGTVVGWLDGTDNEVVARADYTPEGLARYVDEVAGSTCEEVNGARCDKPLGLPFGFHTAYASKVTGLLYFRNRWYSPEANQWLSQDPLDAVDSFNLYAFNGFDSVNFVDPWGLEAKDAATQGAPALAPPPLDPSGAEFDSGSRKKGPLRPAGGDTGGAGEGGDGGECEGPICSVMGSGPGLGEGPMPASAPAGSAGWSSSSRGVGRASVMMTALPAAGAVAGTGIGAGGAQVGSLTGLGRALIGLASPGVAVSLGLGLGVEWCLMTQCLGSGGTALQDPFDRKTERNIAVEMERRERAREEKKHTAEMAGAKDVPSWAKGNKPMQGESGRDFAKRLLDKQFGEGNWSDRGPTSDFNRIKKWGDRSFED